MQNISNFQTLTPLTGGILGAAPAVFAASTVDDESTLTQIGYINDFYSRKQFKDLDYVIINYDSGKQSGVFIVKNTAKEGDPPAAQLVKVINPIPPTPPPQEE
ncbi:MAG: hypothetical protein CFE62_006460 [Candidatus Aquirickettsiella gammari]|jgi:hypothetical protein|uniref:Uncharacterized protein n=1 Tax=Candidatus Aquirickettsiella gammari TaxID=2016198 RepID=A0A370CHU3_9COXI|nr:MAG: hypothetical protein CFE62_006460 [Candidatus Aquirickettsiella gammari]